MADVECLGRLCKVLSEHDNALDVISLHAPLHSVIAHALACLEDYDLTTVGERISPDWCGQCLPYAC
jgi:mediator of RNA polymerase II transcription subunit 5